MSPLRILPWLCLLGLGVARAQTINVENFNQPGAVGAVLPGTNWVNNVTRTPDTIVVAGTARDVNGWGASNQSINATGMRYLTIYARRDEGNVARALVVSFADSSLRTHTLSVSTSLFAADTISAVEVEIGTWPSGFKPAQITDWNIGGGAVPPGTSLMRMTFDHLTLSAASTRTAPAISTQPEDRVIGVGTSTTFTVAATGTPPLRYQWKRGSEPIAGATTATLALTNVAATAAGNYQVDVTNDLGTTPSRVASLTVLEVQTTHALAAANPSGYVAGGTLTITNTITYSGTLSSLGWRVLLPTGWSYASDGGTAPQTKPAAGATGLAEWSWTTVPPSPVTFTYTLNIPANSAGNQSLTAQSLVTQGGITGALLARNDPLIVPIVITYHSGDTNRDFALNLFELTRVIELYNSRLGTTRTGAYTLAATPSDSEDGFITDPSPGATTTLARYHSADSDRDARIGLLELTRVIALYNYRNGTSRTGRYHSQLGTEDGFAPGP